MNKKLIGGIVVLGGISVIAYYFLFSKKSEKKLEQDLLKKFEQNTKTEDELAEIESNLSVVENPFNFNQNVLSPYSPLSQKEISEINEIVNNIGVPKINIVPMDYSGLNLLIKDFDVSSIDTEKLKDIQIGIK